MAIEWTSPRSGIAQGTTPDTNELRLARYVPCRTPSRRLVVLAIAQDRLLSRVDRAIAPDTAPGQVVTLVDHRGRPRTRMQDDALEVRSQQSLEKLGLGMWRVAVYHAGIRPVAGLTAAFTTQLYFWLIIVFLLVAGVGMVATFRYVAREIQTVSLKSDFVSNVTHELKTPLTSIRMFIETLQLGRVKDEAERRECLDIIASESERLSRLIDRVLDFSKMEHGNKVFTFENNDVEKIVRTTIDLFRSQMAEGGGVIRLFIAKSIPRVRCDRDAVREILLNLLSNAIKYSSGNRLVIVRVYATKKTAVIEVTDNGIGIPKTDLKKIFEKFYRVDEKLTRQVEGSGLGLTISQFIAQAHGGEIKVESERGRGSRFSLVLPLPPVKPDEEPA
jgi:signal transduction histidine kinase